MEYPLPNASTDLSGQTALVTGASSGLGLRFAKVLAKCGAKVALAARRLDRLEALADEIRKDGGDAVAIEMDATDADQMIASVAKAEAELGLVTILVNNAGIPDAQRAHKMEIDLIDRVLDINVRAPFVLSCEVARRLMAAGHPGGAGQYQARVRGQGRRKRIVRGETERVETVEGVARMAAWGGRVGGRVG